MKFAQEFKKVLQAENFPQKWVDSAIPYGQLKKCLKRVTGELHELGLDKETLARFTHSSSVPDGDLGFYYHLDGDAANSRRFRPKLTIFVHLNDGVIVDAGLTPATRDFLGQLVSSVQGSDNNKDLLTSSVQERTTPCDPSSSPPLGTAQAADPSAEEAAGRADGQGESSSIRRIEVPLVFDGEFFDLLHADVVVLDDLQEDEQKRLGTEIKVLGNEVTKLTELRRTRRDKPDRTKWREIFQLYLDAGIFFATRESDHGLRTSTQALEKLQWFQDEVFKQNLVQTMKSEASKQAFSKFLNINAALLQNLKFQEINSIAVAKILKKFDKRTSLGATESFRGALHSHRLLAGSVAKDLCAQISSELISTVPQLDDYLCPICFEVAYWPMRLDCKHVFCTRCLVKMSRRCERYCPLCRADVIMGTGVNHYDRAHGIFLKRNFPDEVKQKIKDGELERNREIFGPDYQPQQCSVM